MSEAEDDDDVAGPAPTSGCLAVSNVRRLAACTVDGCSVADSTLGPCLVHTSLQSAAHMLCSHLFDAIQFLPSQPQHAVQQPKASHHQPMARVPFMVSQTAEAPAGVLTR